MKKVFKMKKESYRICKVVFGDVDSYLIKSGSLKNWCKDRELATELSLEEARQIAADESVKSSGVCIEWPDMGLEKVKTW
jgi:uroporphyrinogen-III decarboxylase